MSVADAETTALEARDRLNQLRTRYGQLQAAIRAGDAGEETILEEQRVQSQLVAAEKANEIASTRAYQAKLAKDTADRRSRVNAVMDTFGDLIPRLQMACSDFKTVVDEINRNGLGLNPAGETFEQVLGVPADFGMRIMAAIKEAAPNTQWDYGHTGPQFGNAAKAERPKIVQTTYSIDTGVSGPPPGFSGAWDMLRGRPLEEPILVLPTPGE